MNIKKLIKRIIPKWSFKVLSGQINNHHLKKELSIERKQFIKHYSSSFNYSQDSLKTRLIFNTHAIEKGLSHISFRINFGHTALTNIKTLLDIWNKFSYPKTVIEYEMALSVLKSYKKKHLEISGKVPDFFANLFAHYNSEIDNARESLGGYIKTEAIDSSKLNFKELMANRFSIREFDSSPLNMDKLKDAVRIATRSPSVCNRQTCRVHIIQDPAVMSKIIRIQGGFKGYSNPPLLLILTSDRTCFLSTLEINEPFVDGGIFAMSLMLALQYENLGQCPLNAMMSSKSKEKIRKLANIKPSEEIIMFFVVGNPLKVTPHPLSYRKSDKEITL